MTSTVSTILKWLKLVLVFAVIIAGLWIVYQYTNLFMPFLIALIFAYFLNPVVDFFESRGFSRLWSVIILFLIIGLALVISIYSLFPVIKEQISVLKENIPSYLDRIRTIVLNFIESLSSIMPGLPLEKLTAQLENNVNSFGPFLASQMPAIVTSSLTALGMLIIVPFALFFFLKDGREMKKSIIAIVPNRYFEMVLTLLYEVNWQIGGYIRGRINEGIWIVILTLLGYYIVHLKYAFLLAVIAGVLNIIPYLGPVLGAIPAVIIAMAGPNPVNLVIGIAVITVVVQAIDNVLIVPLAIGKCVDMHPLVVLLAILGGAQLMGIIGMLLAIPLLGSLIVIFKVLYKHLIQYRI